MSRYEADDRYDFERLLDWKKAQVQQGDASGLQPDENYVLTWTVPYGSQEQARNWIYEYRQGFAGPEIPFMQLDGFWRTIQVRYQVVDPKNSNAGVNIQHTIAKGYFTALDWDTARILSDDAAPSNNTSAGIPNTQSATIQKFLQVRFPYIAPESVSQIVGSIGLPSPITIRENTYTGLRKIVEAARLEEDGSYSIVLTLAKPQYTLKSYVDSGGTNEQDVVYLWDVPKDLAQTIIDGWKSKHPVGSSASADYNDSQKLVNIVLRRNALVKPNLTLNKINVACDTTQNFHFAWGYEKADIQAFINAHNSPTGTGSRQVQVQTRSDGLYDITIIETVVTALNPPHFTIVLGVGDKITNTQKYGWNISISQLNAIKADYETKVIGQTKSFRVTREDNCTFDYEGTVVTQTEQEVEVTIVGDGVQTRSKQKRGSTGAVTGYTAGKRKRHRLEVRKEDDGTNTITATEEEIRQGMIAKIDSGSLGISGESGAFSNVDLLPAIPPSAKRVRVQPDLRINEDGTYTGGYTKTSIQPVAQVVSSVGGNGVFTESAAYANLDAAAKAPVSNKRLRVQSTIQANDDGTFSGGYSATTVQISEGFGAISGSGITVKTRSKSNSDNVNTTYSANKRERVSLSIQPNDDGTVNFTETQQTVQQVSVSESKIEGGEGVKLRAKAAKNLDSPPQNVFASAKRKRHTLSISPNDDGTWDSTATEQEVKEVVSQELIVPKNVTKGIKSSTKIYKNTNNYAHGLTGGPRKRHSISASANDDGTIDYSVSEQEVSQTVLTTLSANGSNTRLETAAVFENLDSPPVVPVTKKGEIVTPLITANDDGTFSGGYRKVESLDSNAVYSKAGSKLSKQSITVHQNDRQYNDNSIEPQDGQTVNWAGSINEDGTISWRKVVETAVAGTVVAKGSFSEADFSLSVDYEVMKNQPLSSLSAAPTTGNGVEVTYQNIQIQDNNLCSYIKVTQKLTLNAGSRTVLSEKIEQKRDQAISTKIYNRTVSSSFSQTVTVPAVMFIGRKQKRQVTRSITRLFSITAPSATSSLNQRVRAGTIRMGNINVHYLDTETIDIGAWVADGGQYAGGLYKETFDIGTA